MTLIEADLHKKTRVELIEICKAGGIKGYSKKKKDEVIQLIRHSGTAGPVSIDKFYTIPTVAEMCLDIVQLRYDWSTWQLVIEPSAGNGSFLDKIPVENKLGIDIAPEHKDIIEQDFLTYAPPLGGRILVVGNPPFGRVCSLATKFFNHAACWADVIAFIVPRTFRRISVQNRLNMEFHMLCDKEIPTEPCAFSPPMMAKCCFQIWERRIIKRSTVEMVRSHADWDFLAFGPNDEKEQPTPPHGADFALRAYGGKCGEVATTDLDTLRPKSWHWIRANIDKKILMDRFTTLDYSLSKDTARQNSIGRGELVKLYNDAYAKEQTPQL